MMSRPALGGGSCSWGARSGASTAEAAREKVLLEAIRRHGEITAAVLETALSVEEADLMLSELAVRGHLGVTVEHDRLVYAPAEGVWRSGGTLGLWCCRLNPR
jgi:hypothetical protein